MSCPACDKARSNRYSGEYRVGCFQCCARGFARSTLAADAVRTRDAEQLKDALAKALPTVPIDSALQAVREWWKFDHAEFTTPARLFADEPDRWNSERTT